MVSPSAPPIFSLRHLAEYTGVSYGVLRAIVSRSERRTYRDFLIHKRPTHDGTRRYRRISVPCAPLMLTQKWVNTHILRAASVDEASAAFAPGCSIYEAARSHCNAKWLIKIDVRDFFSSINEIGVYRVFRSLGYQPLVSFELSRLCTRLGGTAERACWINFRPKPSDHEWHWNAPNYMTIRSYHAERVGYLPQGAPTSPMLANLVMRSTDAGLRKLASAWGLTYTRYADDITFSTTGAFHRDICRTLIDEVYRVLSKVGLRPNLSKTHVVPPGARKVVLGLLVDGDKPRLPRDFRMRMRQHLHHLEMPNGPSRHAVSRGFASVSGLRHHLEGLAAFASQIEPLYGRELTSRLKAIVWPA